MLRACRQKRLKLKQSEGTEEEGGRRFLLGLYLCGGTGEEAGGRGVLGYACLRTAAGGEGGAGKVLPLFHCVVGATVIIMSDYDECL